MSKTDTEKLAALEAEQRKIRAEIRAEKKRIREAEKAALQAAKLALGERLAARAGAETVAEIGALAEHLERHLSDIETGDADETDAVDSYDHDSSISAPETHFDAHGWGG